jgi:hypothetical protein
MLMLTVRVDRAVSILREANRAHLVPKGVRDMATCPATRMTDCVSRLHSSRRDP